jgi:hypothetical protein
MRKIVVAKALTLIIFGLYLAAAMARASKVEDRPAPPAPTAEDQLLR